MLHKIVMRSNRDKTFKIMLSCLKYLLYLLAITLCCNNNNKRRTYII